ncbi:hypothetical protein EEW87_16775 [Janibacter melonis]|uniref:Uncharacterized protein n=1 Tax=Janibacter melonis TaxID=262209 RepID=A0A650GF36_9MICO|nr:hypothetical protein [Janibacter melonis]QGX08502.1 hypothetical protein EEW87_16775 [Janibacter melonis]
MDEHSLPTQCPKCGCAQISVVTDRRFDALGEHEKHTVTCSQGHTTTYRDDSAPASPRSLLATVRDALTK